MTNLVEKLSSYNLLNFLLPGATFMFLSPYFAGRRMVPNEVIGQIIIAYFTGLVLSRIGSLVLEAALRGTRLLKPSNYANFVKASRQDEKVSVLLETCNMYRTFAAGALAALISALTIGGFDLLTWRVGAIASLFLLLVVSFIKQYRYVTKRVNANL